MTGRAAILVACAFPWLLLISSGCDRAATEAAATQSPEPKPAQEPSSGAPATKPAETTTKSVAPGGLGAAEWIPADAAYFSSNLGMQKAWDAVVGSRAVKRILALPAAQMALAQVQNHPATIQLLVARDRDPLVRAGLDVLVDAVSHEIFLYADGKLVSVVDAVLKIYGGAWILGLQKGLHADPDFSRDGPSFDWARVVSLVLEHEKALRVPPLILGFRLSDPQRARDLLAGLVGRFGQDLPFPLPEETIGSGDYRTLRLSGQMLPPPARAELVENLRREGLPDEIVGKLDAFLASQTLALSVGIRGDYLLLSIAADTEHLRTLGEGKALASAEALAPVRKRLKPGLCGLTYVHAKIAAGGRIPVDETVAWIGEMIASTPPGSVPEGLSPRLQKDARGLLADLNSLIPEPRPWIVASFFNRGIETFSFSAFGQGFIDPTKPLSIREKAGSRPAALIASRSPPSIDGYRRVAHWIQVAYGYFTDYAVPKMSEGEREDFQQFERLFIPTIGELHQITQELFLPAIDAAQSVVVVDTEGRLPFLPGTRGPLAQPLAYPRPALVLEVRDPEKLKEAFRRYREAVNRLLKSAEKELGSEGFQIPPPDTRPHAGGTLYTYPLPQPLGPDLEPHVLLAGNLAVVSIAPSHSKDIVESTTALPKGEVSLSEPAGMVSWVDLGRLTGMIATDAAIAVDQYGKEGMLDPDDARFIGLHLPEIQKALGAWKSYSARVYREGDLQVRHSWLQIEDLEE